MARGNKGGFSIELAGDWDAWSKWSAAIDGNLERAANLGTRRAMQYVQREIIERIRSGRYKSLAPLTANLRQLDGYGTTPLLRTQGLVRSIASSLVDSWTGEVGLNKKGRFGRGRDKASGRFTAGGESNANIGLLLHDGGIVRVTEKMRIAFQRRLGRALSKAGASRLPGMRGNSKGRIRIPPRPFIKDVFEDPAVLAKIQTIYREALRRYTGL